MHSTTEQLFIGTSKGRLPALRHCRQNVVAAINVFFFSLTFIISPLFISNKGLSHVLKFCMAKQKSVDSPFNPCMLCIKYLSPIMSVSGARNYLNHFNDFWAHKLTKCLVPVNGEDWSHHLHISVDLLSTKT